MKKPVTIAGAELNLKNAALAAVVAIGGYYGTNRAYNEFTPAPFEFGGKYNDQMCLLSGKFAQVAIHVQSDESFFKKSRMKIRNIIDSESGIGLAATFLHIAADDSAKNIAVESRALEYQLKVAVRARLDRDANFIVKINVNPTDKPCNTPGDIILLRPE